MNPLEMDHSRVSREEYTSSTCKFSPRLKREGEKGGREFEFLVKPNHRGQSDRGGRECLNIPVSKIAANGGWTVLIEKYRHSRE